MQLINNQKPLKSDLNKISIQAKLDNKALVEKLKPKKDSRDQVQGANSVEIKNKLKPVTKSITEPSMKKAINESKKIINFLNNNTAPKKGIYFINGMYISALSSNQTGMKNLAESFEGARYYSWEDQTKILEHISKLKPQAPVVLVGHSLGGDAALEIAQKLNTLKNGFKKVDLLVTIDSFGLNNDIVPTNVKKNLNYFGEKDFFLNDAPNIARNKETTNVQNYLRPEHHTELDDSNHIQADITRGINEVLSAQV
jgi:hypothetical protein